MRNEMGCLAQAQTRRVGFALVFAANAIVSLKYNRAELGLPLFLPQYNRFRTVGSSAFEKWTNTTVGWRG